MIDLPTLKAQFHYNPATGEIKNRASISFLIDIPGTIGVFGVAPENTYYVAETESFVEIPEQPDAFHVWDWPTKTWNDPRTLIELKLAQRAILKAERDRVIISGFAVDGMGRFDSDAKSKTNIMGMALSATRAQMASAPFSVDWILEDNSVVTLDANQMIEVATAMEVFSQAQYKTCRELQADVEAATTKAQIETITWPTP